MPDESSLSKDQINLLDGAGARMQLFCLDHDIEFTEEKLAIFMAGAAYGVEKCHEIGKEDPIEG